jgi:hypothetical protein
MTLGRKVENGDKVHETMTVPSRIMKENATRGNGLAAKIEVNATGKSSVQAILMGVQNNTKAETKRQPKKTLSNKMALDEPKAKQSATKTTVSSG